MADRCRRIAVAALVHALFVLAVERIRERGVRKRPEAEPLEAHRGQIERQIVEVGDQVAIAAQQLVVALAVVLDRAHVGGDEAGVRIQNPVRPHGAAHLVEPGVGKPIVHQHVGTDSQKPRDGRVRIDAVPRANRPGSTATQRARHTKGRRGIADNSRAAAVSVTRACGAAQAGAPARTRQSADRRRTRVELNAPAQGIAAVLRARGSAQHFDRLERVWLDQIQEGVHAAALRAI